MYARLRHAVLFTAGFSSGAFALGQIQVENAAVGQRTLVITFDDSVQSPDLSKIRVEGYEIENAIFVEELGAAPTRFTAGFLDLTLPGQGKIIEYAPTPGSMILELPTGVLPQIGNVLADTAFGGLLRKVVEVDPQPQPGSLGRRWLLKTEEADLPDAVQDCDISFKSRLDMNQALGDLHQSQDLTGLLATRLEDGTGEAASAFGRLDIGIKSAQVLFQPVVTGRIQVRNGKVELFNFQVNGDCEVMANLNATVAGKGEFEFEEELPGKSPMLLPLGSGLFLRMQNRPFLRIEARNAGDVFSAQADFRIRNSIKGELGYRDGQWRPLAENKMTWANKSLQNLWGNGEVNVALKPRIEMLLEGVQGPVFTFEPYARFASAPAVTAPGMASMTGPGGPGGSAGPGQSWVAPGSGAALALVPSPVPAAESSALTLSSRAFTAATGETRVYGIGNKELTLGANIFMETRTNFTGPSSLRNFLLFNREQTVLSPPREGTLFLKLSDSNRVALQCQTFPRSDYYLVQQRLGSGPWETVLDRAPVPKIRLAGLKPSSQYRFRAIGVNAFGYGAPFPPEGVVFNSPAANRPPFMPLAAFPDSGALVPDSVPLLLSWKGGDPDAGAKVQYSVYLDTKFPPLVLRAGNLIDSVLSISDLKPGTTYYWKVIASDGLDHSEGPVRSFSTKSLEPVLPQPPKGIPAYYPLVFVPKGSYRRDDGRLVKVGPLFLGKYEVTQTEFEKFTGRNPSYRLQDSLPVDRVTWEEADAFCRETGGRLPTEAEWEYAARAGSASTFYWGVESPKDYAWYRDNSENRTQKVGSKKPNGWGLYDMAGNVFEWVQDWYGDYSQVEVDHPKGPGAGTAKVIRGASWYSESGSLSLTARYNNRPGFRNFKVGFRCAQDPDRTAGAAWDDPTSALAGKSTDLSLKPDVSPAK